jgi:hypothetical protein
MSLKIRFKFDGRCRLHPRYNPETDGQTSHKDCPGCDSLWVIFLYTGIAQKKAESGEGMLVSRIDAGKAAAVGGNDDETGANSAPIEEAS